jgi:outer membrane receptor protein involved in Fe transport
MVAAVNSLYRLGAGFSLVGSVGRAFRSPNLIERFFDGPTPEGSGYQVRNPDLKPETSLNVDLGVRYRHGPMSLEGFAFHNKIRDGVRIAPLGTKVQGQDAYQNVNVDQLVFRGVELNGDVFLDRGFAVGASFSKMDAKDAVNVENPVGETFSSKVTGYVRYTVPSDRGWVEWQIRHNGNRKDVALVDNPVGDHLPAFTVQDVRAGVTLFRTASGVTNTLNLALTNVTNALYAEFSNVSFFRPEPKRNLTLSWDVSF